MKELARSVNTLGQQYARSSYKGASIMLSGLKHRLRHDVMEYNFVGWKTIIEGSYQLRTQFEFPFF